MSNLSHFCEILLHLPLVFFPGGKGQQQTPSCFTATFYMLEDYYGFLASFCRQNKANSFNFSHKLFFFFPNHLYLI